MLMLQLKRHYSLTSNNSPGLAVSVSLSFGASSGSCSLSLPFSFSISLLRISTSLLKRLVSVARVLVFHLISL